MDSGVNKAKTSNKELIEVFKTLLSVYPELQIFLRLQCLNREIRQAITLDFYIGVRALYYRNVSKVPQDFLL